MDSRTKNYYETNSEEYFFSTVNACLKDALEEFLSLLRPSARILDCGCGSGRDARYFLSLGYQVDALDCSENMCRLASSYTGLDVKCMDYMSLNPEVPYSGIWAEASLVHERREKLADAFGVLSSSLEDGGVLYASFRLGVGEMREGERWYTYMNEDSLLPLIPESLSVIRIYESDDVRSGLSHRWLNIFLRKEKKRGAFQHP